MINIWKCWENKMQIPGTHLHISGMSVAGLRTCFYIHELQTLLDAGISFPYSPRHIFITHGHSDHIANLPLSVIGMRRPTVYCPHQIVSLINNYVQSMNDLTDGCENMSNALDLYKPIGLTPGDTFHINGGYIVKTYECDHRAPTLAYGFTRSVQKLMDEFKSLTGAQIKELKKTKENEMFKTQTTHDFLFCGDTTIKLFDNPEVLQYKTIMVECSFLHESEKEHAQSKKHMYWGDLLDVVKAHPQTTFILIHFSLRYSWEEIQTTINAAGVSNVVCWDSYS